MRRGKPMKRKGWLRPRPGTPALARGRGLPKRNAKRLARLEARNFGPHASWVRKHACATCGKPGPSEASHAITRKMGGCGGDRRVLFPQCHDCHRAYEEHRGITKDEALALAAWYWQHSPHRDDAREAA